MMYRHIISLCVITLGALLCHAPCCVDCTVNMKISETKYEPNWESIDARPLPAWYDDEKIGIFLHWGVFSVPAYQGAWFWYWWKGPNPNLAVVEWMQMNYKPSFTYADFAPKFTATFYQPNRWAEIFKASGAKYIVLTTKHHEGYCLWPTKYSWNWNSMDVGPKRDLVGDLATAVRAQGLRFGAYHSLYEWFNPLYIQDKKNNFTTNEFVKRKTMPELYELVYNYQPDVIWSDGDWEAPAEYWNSTGFLAWLYNDSPVKDKIVTNDRWGKDCMCHHGGFLTCHDKYEPATLQKRKFEDATTMDKYAWTHRRNLRLSDVHTPEEVVAIIAQVVSVGGNLLINVGPTADGMIIPVFEERLRQMGSWLEVNGEGIYKTRPWTYQNDSLTPDVWYTAKKSAQEDKTNTVYAILLKWPVTKVFTLNHPMTTIDTQVTMLGYNSTLDFVSLPGKGLQVQLPDLSFHQLPCRWGWTFKISYVMN